MAVTPDGKTLYVASPEGPPAVTPISTATNTPGTPIRHVLHAYGYPGEITITPR